MLRLLEYPKVYYRAQKFPPMAPILNYINEPTTPKPIYLRFIYLRVCVIQCRGQVWWSYTFTPSYVFIKGDDFTLAIYVCVTNYTFFTFPDQNFVCTSIHLHACDCLNKSQCYLPHFIYLLCGLYLNKCKVWFSYHPPSGLMSVSTRPVF
jgi:hypothetical protein